MTLHVPYFANACYIYVESLEFTQAVIFPPNACTASNCDIAAQYVHTTCMYAETQ